MNPKGDAPGLSPGPACLFPYRTLSGCLRGGITLPSIHRLLRFHDRVASQIGDDRHFPLGDRLRQRRLAMLVESSPRTGRPYRAAPSKGARSRMMSPFLTAHAETDAATDNHRYRDDQDCPGEEEGEHG